EAAVADTLRTLAHAPGGALRAISAAVGRLAADRAPDEALADASAHLADDAGVLVAEHERRLPREQALRRVDVRTADPGGVDGDDDLTGPGHGLRRCVDGGAALALPGGDLLRRPVDAPGIGPQDSHVELRRVRRRDRAHARAGHSSPDGAPTGLERGRADRGAATPLRLRRGAADPRGDADGEGSLHRAE